MSKPTVLVGEETDLLVLLCFHTKSTSRNIYFLPEPKHGAKHQPKCWKIALFKTTIHPEVCNSVLFMHAILGCDTTYDIYGIGKIQITVDSCESGILTSNISDHFFVFGFFDNMKINKTQNYTRKIDFTEKI